MELEELAECYTCPVCLDFPRPYAAPEFCESMHMVCGVCYSQFTKKRKIFCITCRQKYKKFPIISGYHGPLKRAQEQYSYSCLNDHLGCDENELSCGAVALHDKLCLYTPYSCLRKECVFQCPWQDLHFVEHSHLKTIISSRISEGWTFKIPLVHLFSKLQHRIRLCKLVPQFALTVGSPSHGIGIHFKTSIKFAATLDGSAIVLKFYWQTKEIFSLLEDVHSYNFIVQAYVPTSVGKLIHTNVGKLYYIFSPNYSNCTIPSSFFANALKAFKLSNCDECPRSLIDTPHIHFKITLGV